MSVFERHPRTTLAVLALVGVVGSDLAFTAAYRAFVHPDRPTEIRTRSAVYHHGFRPRAEAVERWGPWTTRYATNSLGFRDRAVRDVPARGDRFRLVLIGDSFTEGIGVPWEDTFAGRVESALAPRGIEVLDAGVASYCPILYERRIRQLLEDGTLHFDHLAVFIDIGDILDEVTYKEGPDGGVVSRENRRIAEERENRRFEGSIDALWPLQRALREHTLLLSTIYELALMPRRARGRRAALWTMDDEVFAAYGKEGLERADAHMDALHRLLAARGIGLTVAVYPWPDHLLLGDRDSRQRRFWRDWTAARGVGFVDCFPPFFEGDPRQMAAREFIPGDIHWNAAGHARVARTFLESWDRRPR